MFTILILYKIRSITYTYMDQNKKILIGAGVTLVAFIGYAIYTDLSRLFPKRDCDKSKCKDNKCC